MAEQDFPRDQFEVIVVNDGGNDNTAEVISKYQSQYSLIYKINNHGGVCKARNEGIKLAQGEVLVFFDDDAEQECFRKYDSGEESYTDHALFLTSRPYYIPLFSLEKDDYKSWAYGLKKAGYATDVNYPTKLITLIEKYNLDKYDSEVLGKTPRITELLVVSNPNDQTYEVAPGDTLYSIARRFKISVPDLVRKNNISNNALSIGQNLIVN
jgi:glycosyltransferase involved in cell wall biosynthesis